MTLPDIDFTNIRARAGQQSTAFEDLITELARDERVDGESFWSKGPGADGGLECYKTKSDGTEKGWQGKFVKDWGAAAGQLTSSFKRALKTHPYMSVFVVCVPFDLSDGRKTSKKTGKQLMSSKDSYETWKTKHIAEAKAEERSINIEFWGKAELRNRLLKGPSASARIRYWFDATLLDGAMLEKLFLRTESALGERYVPAHHVDLPIMRCIDAITRSPAWRGRVDHAIGDMTKAITATRSDLRNPKFVSPLAEIQMDDATAKVRSAQTVWDAWKGDRKSTLPFVEMAAAFLKILDLCRAMPLDSATSSPSFIIKDRLEAVASIAGRLHTCFHEHSRILGDQQSLLVFGAGGIGKSHLLADAVGGHIEAGVPAILVLAGSFQQGVSPWTSVAVALEEPSLPDATTLLETMNAAGSAVGETALICIDAINEGAAYPVWPRDISSFLKRASEYKNVAVVLTCRTPALPSVLPIRPIVGLLEVEHPGFGGTAGRAAAAYIKSRGLSRSPLARPSREFDNPLLLKLVCDALLRDRETDFPNSLDYLSDFFDYALKSIYLDINTRLGLDPFLEVPQRALLAFAGKAFEENGFVEYHDADDVCKADSPTTTSPTLSILQTLIGSGILTHDVDFQRGSNKNHVRFTFEKMGDFVTATLLIDDGLAGENLKSGSSLEQIFLGDSVGSPSILPTIALVLADRFTIEVTDLVPGILSKDRWKRAFEDSLERRRPDAVTAKSLSIAQKNLDGETLLTMAISRIGQPGKYLGIEWLNAQLRSRKMIERDLSWSRYLLNDHGRLNAAIMSLIVWTETADITGLNDKASQDLCQIFAWTLATSHREIRDRATKCIVRLIAGNLQRGVGLIAWCEGIDDLYIHERVYAALYGAALQSPNDPNFSILAHRVYDALFSENTPPPNLLLRDHATSLLELAEIKSDFDANTKSFSYQGPYTDPGPLAYVTQNWTPQAFEKEEKWGDQVWSSLMNMGDFGNKIVEPFITQWSPVGRDSLTLPTEQKLFEAWLDECVSNDAFVSECWAVFDSFVAEWNQNGRPDNYDMGNDWKVALVTLKEAIGVNAFCEFERRGFNYARRHLHDPTSGHHKASFDSEWARRWLWKRVRDFGWSPASFNEIDRAIGGDCRDHRRERFGKKYQWLAFYELGARLQDHYAREKGGWGDDHDSPAPYSHKIGVDGVRNIDPSLLRLETHYDGWAQSSRTWWSPLSPDIPAMTPREQLNWLHGPEDYIRGDELIEVRDPCDGYDWLTLSSFVRVSKSLDDKGLGSRSWCRIQCFVVPIDQKKTAITELGQHMLTSPSDPVRAYLPYWTYLGEIGFKCEMAEVGQENRPYHYKGIGDIWATTVGYLRERSGYDYSIKSNVGVDVPLPWLSKLCKTNFSDGNQISYVDAKKQTIFMDPSVDLPGPSSCLVRRSIFLGALEEAGLTPIWIEAGEKGVFGNDTYGGQICFTRLYTLNDQDWEVYERTEVKYPSAEQLDKFISPDKSLTSTEIGIWSRERALIEPS